jgi:putative Mn2+ efflux pump MntP
VSLLALDANIAIAAPLIALTTFICCLVALVLGRRFGMLLGDKAEIAGGVVLILIGIKALL